MSRHAGEAAPQAVVQMVTDELEAMRAAGDPDATDILADPAQVRLLADEVHHHAEREDREALTTDIIEVFELRAKGKEGELA